MAASCCRREGVPSPAPKFFKIILDPLADSLRIPAEFMERYGQNLPKRVLLKVPSGSVLEVELVQSNGETLLHKGWKEFKYRYSIGFGYFLVFEYNGNSKFDVLIFDTSASEINYPLNVDFEKNQAPKVSDNGTELDYSVVLEQFSTRNRGKVENLKDYNKSESDVSIEVLDNPQARQQSNRKRRHCDDTIGLSSDYPLKESFREAQNVSSYFEKDSRSKFSAPTYHSDRALHSKAKLEKSTSEEYGGGTGKQLPQKQRAVANETSIAYQKAIAFTSAHTLLNPFFISLMRPSYVSYGFLLNVPSAFAKGNLPCKSTNLAIRLMNGKEWKVRFIRCGGHRKLSSGWVYFVQDNALKVGDACLFEVVESNKDFVWNVTIFRS